MTDPAQFFLERYAAEMPQRIHSRGVWHDESGASELGAPNLSREFESWLTDGDGHWQTGIREDQDHCNHPTAQNPCPVCDDSGLRVRVRSTFRHPMKRALAHLHAVPVPKGRPALDVTLIVLAENDGNVGLTIAALAAGYSFMWQPVKGRRWIMHALWRFRAAYREDAPARMLRKSESQEIAEVAA